ncbi:MAG TPA: RagB/SusD family nutrient uptake outer membrane protein [Longimicrobiales bacterium]|nr:RagB/SusD family nutrient uptake outer membrane protein [Longimicrobiales bacterium]
MSIRTVMVAALVSLTVAGCDLNLQNPNAPTQDQVLSDIEGLKAVAVGMQDEYASNVDTYVQAPALVTDEWGTKSRALLAWISLMTGENFDNTYGTVEGPWAASYRVIKAANTLIEGVPQSTLGAGFQAGMLGLAHLFKGMALGQLYLHYQQAPIDISSDQPTPAPRGEVLDSALAEFASAKAALQGVSAADLGGFNSTVKGAGLDLMNTINAMMARYSLFKGNDQDAIDAANAVDPTVLSTFDYVSPSINPINDLAFRTDYVAGLQSFAADAMAGDQRPAYWLQVGAAAPTGNPADTLLYELNQYTSTGDPYPIYLPDEMKLIKAEALTDLGAANYAQAAALINEVHTQTSSPVNEPLAGMAAIPNSSLSSETQLLTQIAYERRYELYMQGLRWEDMRRLGTYITDTYTMEFLPTPQQECLSNAHAGC